MRSYVFKLHTMMIFTAILLTSCNQTGKLPGSKRIVKVDAGISLTQPFQDMEKEFESRNKDIDVQINFAGGQQQLEQMNNGANVDIFAPVKEQQMRTAIKFGLVEDGTQEIFASDQLVVIMPKANPGKIQTLNDLTKPGIKIVVGADTSAIGQYTATFLEKTGQDASFGPGYKEAVLRNIVSREKDVKAVVAKIVSGEGDAGIVFYSDLVSPDKEKLDHLDIPASLELINYTIAVTKPAQKDEAANQFLDFVISPEGQAILEKDGFLAK